MSAPKNMGGGTRKTQPHKGLFSKCSSLKEPVGKMITQCMEGQSSHFKVESKDEWNRGGGLTLHQDIQERTCQYGGLLKEQKSLVTMRISSNIKTTSEWR